EGRADRAAEGGHIRKELHEPPGREPLPLTLELERLNGLETGSVPDEPVRFRTDQHLPWRSRLFEPGGDIHSVTGDQLLVGRRIAGHDLARIDAGPDRHPN